MRTARISSTGEHRSDIRWGIATFDGATRARSAILVVGNVDKLYVTLVGQGFRIHINASHDDYSWSVARKRFAHKVLSARMSGLTPSSEALSVNKVNLAQAEPVADAKLPANPGCYVLAAGPEAVRELGLTPRSDPVVLYVGKAETGVRARVSRTHLVESRTGSSTLRRSIGALLRKKLDLNPQPRSEKPRDSKRYTNYRFDAAGEERLTKWIAARVRVIGVASADPCTTEADLIDQLRPPLNLTKLGGWKNPDKRMIETKRKECAALARRHGDRR
ncbi:MAG: hypothetical protein OXG79_06045 [Chloroflexi bacterium]|nr:hypothetical protein [Chloroflexota bacterium]